MADSRISKKEKVECEIEDFCDDKNDIDVCELVDGFCDEHKKSNK